MPTKWYNGTITDIQDMSPTTRQFVVNVDGDGEGFDFLPGQFVTIDLPVSEKRLHRWRSYSIANDPDGSNVLEFCIVRSEEGLGTKYLFDEAQIGTILKFKGPDGGFVLPADLTKDIIMVCTGTGVAPFRSMVRHVISQEMDFNHIHLIFGTRYSQGILYQEEFEKIKDEHPNFDYSIALSREHSQGVHHQGYVHDVYMSRYQQVHPDRHFYICGWSQMIDQAVAHLMIDLKYDKSQIHYELYG
ncbi:MAG: FAD-dependent oxidoreductase [Saprospiraceae bacterium]